MKWKACAAAVAVLAVAGCNQGGVPIPATPEGAQAPQELTATAPTRGRARLTDEERTQWEGAVRTYLDALQTQSGLPKHATLEDVIVPMEPGRDHRWYVDLQQGESYAFVGACDSDCSNVDLEIIAPGGGVVSSDLLPDDWPVANLTAGESGRFIVRLSMIACEVSPCFAGARVLSVAQTGPAPK